MAICRQHSRAIRFGRSVARVLGFAALALAAGASMSHDGEREDSSLKVKLTVHATDPNGRALSYRWRSTDGHIANVDAPTTTWTLADGPGVHFAYVLVSNGAGGYTERRFLVNTDTIGTPVKSRERARYRAPASAGTVGEVYRSFMRGASAAPGSTSVFNIPGVLVFAKDADNTIRFPGAGAAQTNVRGEFTISSMLPIAVTDQVNFFCDVDPLGSFGACGATTSFAGDYIVGDSTGGFDLTAEQAVTDYIYRLTYTGEPPNHQVTAGTALLADNTPCGTVNEFFGITSTGTASLLDGSNHVIAGPVPLSDLGAYVMPYNPLATTVLIQCEAAAPQYKTIAFAGDVGRVFFPATGQPIIPDVGGMTATLHGAPLSPPTGKFLPLPSGPSDIVPSAERFISYKGIDSRPGACAYYRAIGAAKGCDSRGNLVGAISFDDWMRATKMGKYAMPGPTEFTASYINRADLNLARNHHSISYGAKHTAAYVCNHLGPLELDPPQAEVDAVVDTLVNNQNLVACVAMDFTASPGVNFGNPYVRFLIFGPNGQLLPSINLDGRREKFVPGTCVACHGGDHYAGHYLARDNPDVGAHFLPYDSGNFEFSTKPGLTELDQQEAIYNLNQNVLNVNPTVAEKELIAGWYLTSHALDKTYVPDTWKSQTDVPTSIAVNFYQNVVARSCRGCHVAMVEGYNWDRYQSLWLTNYRGTSGFVLPETIACGGVGGANRVFRSHSMPNSLVTFNRYWGSAGNPIDQVAISNAFFAAEMVDPVVLGCTP
jgi:hypothetical protein